MDVEDDPLRLGPSGVRAEIHSLRSLQSGEAFVKEPPRLGVYVLEIRLHIPRPFNPAEGTMAGDHHPRIERDDLIERLQPMRIRTLPAYGRAEPEDNVACEQDAL